MTGDRWWWVMGENINLVWSNRCLIARYGEGQRAHGAPQKIDEVNLINGFSSLFS